MPPSASPTWIWPTSHRSRHPLDSLLKEGRPIHLLVLNAGMIALGDPVRHTSVDGFELHLQTNHLGHFAFVARILPLLRAGRARVTVQSSLAARSIGVRLRRPPARARLLGVPRVRLVQGRTEPLRPRARTAKRCGRVGRHDEPLASRASRSPTSRRPSCSRAAAPERVSAEGSWTPVSAGRRAKHPSPHCSPSRARMPHPARSTGPAASCTCRDRPGASGSIVASRTRPPRPACGRCRSELTGRRVRRDARQPRTHRRSPRRAHGDRRRSASRIATRRVAGASPPFF